jgi:CO dehydrogenase nickel-insertion accessory protein CooC1
MEHVSRRTSDSVDHLFVVAQPTMASLGVAKRILDTAEDVELAVDQKHLVLNAVDGDGFAHPQVGSLTVDGEVIEIVRDEGVRQAWMLGNLIGYEGPAADALAPTLERLIA